MAKDKKAREPSPPYNVDLRVPSFRVLENVKVHRMTDKITRFSYRRKRSGYHDIEIVPNERILAIIGPASGEAGGSMIVILEPQLPLEDIQRAFKLNGAVEETDTGYLEVTNQETGAVSFVNPKYAIIKRPDDEANANVPKRGRRPKPKLPEEENVPSKASLLIKKKKKSKLKDKAGRRDRDREDTKVRKARSSDW